MISESAKASETPESSESQSLGASEPGHLGASVPRSLESSEYRCLGALEPWNLGSLYRGYLEPPVAMCCRRGLENPSHSHPTYSGQ